MQEPASALLAVHPHPPARPHKAGPSDRHPVGSDGANDGIAPLKRRKEVRAVCTFAQQCLNAIDATGDEVWLPEGECQSAVPYHVAQRPAWAEDSSIYDYRPQVLRTYICQPARPGQARPSQCEPGVGIIIVIHLGRCGNGVDADSKEATCQELARLQYTIDDELARRIVVACGQKGWRQRGRRLSRSE
ncbi:hypothetical protein B0T26DRAFT_671043 [Lasiosphaeria miniovina]|uniref:Uncharacterized protein n=1 Tax=Lasiosphaeria miniovina TaxID=1954250 RepID=A0AA40BIF2_9PEZI|nr:uncharacterized protein B0T26DRAFT_671043 [Lasiosphaeria miniovina]KAK0734806.1 hypothetical protein B0T26DRAFT_671043 [Lasiosphaeria miniovina]